MSNQPLCRMALGLGLVALASGSVLAGPVQTFHWMDGDPGTVDQRGGRINWIETEFDSDNQTLRWTGNFGNHTRLRTDGFTLAISGGSSPKHAAGDVALFYFDSNYGPASSPLDQPVLTAYTYNGNVDMYTATSYMDGSGATGTQDPDPIASSAVPGANDWVEDLFFRAEADGSRTMGFEIDVSSIIGHTPLHPASNWTGTGFGEEIGMWMQTYTNLNTDYEDGYVTGWNSGFSGSLELGNMQTAADPVPEPATLTLFGLGAAGFFGRRLRRRKQDAQDHA